MVIEQFYASLLAQDKKLCSGELLGDVADLTFMVGGWGEGVLCVEVWLSDITASLRDSFTFTLCHYT